MAGARLVNKGEYTLSDKLIYGYMLVQSVITEKWNVVYIAKGYTLFEQDVDAIELYADSILRMTVGPEFRYFDLQNNRFVSQLTARAFRKSSEYWSSTR